MANATTLNIGQANGAGDRKALFLKVFGGEVMVAYQDKNEILDRHMTRSIASGKSAAFPATWRVGAAYHTPGAEIVGQATNVNERVITIDDILLADVFIPNIDEAMNHYDYRSIYSAECGAALRRAFNANVMQVALLAARATATVTGAFGGSALTNAAFATDGAVLADGLYDASQALDEKDVPEERFAFFKPLQYNLVIKNKDAIDKDYDGSGSFSKGVVREVAGIEIVKSNNLPSTNVTTGPAAYQGNFTNTRGLVMTKAAVGTVSLLDLSVESEYDIRRQGTLIVAKYLKGSGILRPECAVEMKTA